MKLLVFAHTPPPHHGQSYMVQLMLEAFGGDARNRSGEKDGRAHPPAAESEIECYHVNARVSKDLADVGGIRLGKLLLLLLYCAEAIWCRFRYGIDAFYYIPAPAKLSAVYRDWIVMLLCRPFSPRIILHWHAFGLGEWASGLSAGGAGWHRRVTRRLLHTAQLSIVPTKYNCRDAEVFEPQRIEVIPNAIPDPVPEFETHLLPLRLSRVATREQTEASDARPRLVFKLLFLAHCTRQKGLYDAIDAVAIANASLAEVNSPLRMHLSVAGTFLSASDEEEFRIRISAPDLKSTVAQSQSECAVHYVGFVQGEQKHRLLSECDCLCFPTYHHAEAQPVTIIEALAFGMPIVTTRWRGVPEMAPDDVMFLAEAKTPTDVAGALLKAARFKDFAAARRHFLETYHIDRFADRLARSLLDLPESR